MANKIACIILNYRKIYDTIICIKSLLKIKGIKIFLVQNSENDEETLFLRKYLSNLPQIKIITKKRNLGFAAGVNYAIKIAIDEGFTKYFLFNNDAVLIPNAENIIEEEIKKIKCAILSPAIQWNDGICKKNYYNKYIGLIERKRKPLGTGWEIYFTGCALAFDIDVLKKIGQFDESFFMYGEDILFCYKARKNRIPLVFIDQVVVFHKGSLSSGLGSFFYEYHMNKMHLLLVNKMIDSTMKKMMTLIVKSGFLTARSIIRSFRYKSLIPIKALILSPFPIKVRPNQK